LNSSTLAGDRCGSRLSRTYFRRPDKWSGLAGRIFLLLLSGFLATACGGGPESATPDTSENGALERPQSGLPSAFRVVRRLELEETDRILVSRPLTYVASENEFLLVEFMEGQVRMYDKQGKLLGNWGSKGQGPGELMYPVSARRALDGRILVADLEGRLTFYSTDGSDSVEVVASPLVGLLGAEDLGGGRYLMGGIRATDSGNSANRLHIWNRETDEIEHSFLQPRVPEEHLLLASTYSSVFAVVERDVIWATWPLADTVYKFDRDGNRMGVLPIPMPRTERWISSGDVELSGSGTEGLPDVSTAERLFLLNDGGLVIEVAVRLGSEFLVSEPVWDLVVVDSLGNERWKGTNLPRLQAVVQDTFYFQDPSTLHPNFWIAAEFVGEEAADR